MYGNLRSRREASPEDNTTVIKMVKEFHEFLAKSPPARKDNQEFSFGNKSGILGGTSLTSFNLTDSSKLHSSAAVSDTDLNDGKPGVSKAEKISCHKKRSMMTLTVDEKAELIASRSKAAKLEVQLKSLDSERRRSDIEEDKKRKLLSVKNAKDQEEIDVLRRKYKELVEQKQAAVDELEDFKKSYDELKSDLNSRIDELECENMEVKTCLDELSCEKDSELIELREKYNMLKVDYMQCKENLAESETCRTIDKNRLDETNKMVSDYIELKSQCQLAEGKILQLEQKLREQEETNFVVQKSHKQLAHYSELEKENKRLREDNLLYKDSATNSLILEEKLASLRPKVEEIGQLKEKVEQLEYENEALLNKLKSWECPDASNANKKARSPADMTRIISALQQSELNLTASNSQLGTRARLTDSLLEAKQDECHNLLKQFTSVTSKNELLEDKTQKLQRRLKLLTTERDGLRHVLSSYENEEGTASKIHMQQVEEKVNQYHQQIKVLEDELAASKMEAVNQKAKYLELQQEFDKSKVSLQISSENIKAVVADEKLKEQFEELKMQYEKVLDEKEILELRMEKKEMQGDYDPTKTKALYLKNNPYQIAQEAYQKKIKDTFVENEKMRKKIIKLQTANEELVNESMNVSRLISNSKPMEDALKQVQEWKLKYKRLEEEYVKSAKKIMIAVKNLLGYSVKETKANTFRLQSIYSEDHDDFFLFECSQTKDKISTGVIQTQFTKQWTKHLEKYVGNCDSIPLFLASVNMELFS